MRGPSPRRTSSDDAGYRQLCRGRWKRWSTREDPVRNRDGQHDDAETCNHQRPSGRVLDTLGRSVCVAEFTRVSEREVRRRLGGLPARHARRSAEDIVRARLRVEVAGHTDQRHEQQEPTAQRKDERTPSMPIARLVRHTGKFPASRQDPFPPDYGSAGQPDRWNYTSQAPAVARQSFLFGNRLTTNRNPAHTANERRMNMGTATARMATL